MTFFSFVVNKLFGTEFHFSYIAIPIMSTYCLGDQLTKKLTIVSQQDYSSRSNHGFDDDVISTASKMELPISIKMESKC